MTDPAISTTPVSPTEGQLTTADLAGRHEPEDKAANAPTGDNRPVAVEADPSGDRSEPLFPAQDVSELRASWDNIQASFVDEPRKAVQDADSLVATAMQRLAETFADERSTLEGQWDRGDEVSTEDLRLALRRYRSFFGRLLSV